MMSIILKDLKGVGCKMEDMIINGNSERSQRESGQSSPEFWTKTKKTSVNS